MSERRDYSGNAKPTTIGQDITSGSLTWTISDPTGWPSGTNGKFFATLAAGLSNEERVLVLSRSGSTLALESTDDRGVDGTSAASHDAGTTISHTFSAVDADEANRHINTTGDDNHTQYLNVARHDLAARHTVGTVIPTAAPAASAVGDAQVEGVSTSLARADHKHAREAWGTVVDVGAVSDDGSGTTVAHANHVHGLGAATLAAIFADVMTLAEATLTDDTVSAEDAWQDWGTETINLGDPGMAVAVQGWVSGDAINNDATSSADALVRVAISYDNGSSFLTDGNSPSLLLSVGRSGGVAAGYIRPSATPTGNVIVKAQIRQTGAAQAGDVQWRQGRLGAFMVPQ